MRIDQCDGKEPFASKLLADKVAGRNRRKDRGRRTYKCPHCRQWHLSGTSGRLKKIARAYLVKEDEDWTFVERGDVRALAEYVWSHVD